MGMSEQRGLMAHCDKDGCRSIRWGTIDELPVGYHGTVQNVIEDEEGDVIVLAADWFACKQHHIAGAVLGVLGNPKTTTITNASARLRDLQGATQGRVVEVTAVAS